MSMISTGSSAFDELLGGGFESSILTTIYGPAGTGKTTLILNFLAKTLNGQKVIFIDTQNSFSTERFKQLCPSNFEKALESIIIFKANSFAEQKQAVDKVNDFESQSILAVFVDSLTSHYRSELPGSDLKASNKSLISQMRTLIEFSKRKNIPLIATSEVSGDLEEKNKINLVGGMMVRNHSKTLIELQKSGRNRLAILEKHRTESKGKRVLFRITSNGIVKIDGP